MSSSINGPTAQGARSGRPLLLVDDDPILCMIGQEALSQNGFQVQVAGDGEAALAAVRERDFALILLDVVMPGIDGFETCRRLRALPEAAGTPVIIMTGLEEVASIDHAYDNGADDFITKPIDWSLLFQRIRFVIRATSMRQRLAQMESMQRALLHGIPDSVLRITRDGKVLDAKMRGTELLGQPRRRLSGSQLREILPEGFAAACLDAVRQALDGNAPRYFESSVQAPEGKRWYETRITPRGRADVVAIIRNVTARRDAEQRLRTQQRTLEHQVAQRTAELQQAMEELESFNYSVSHDLRTPLRAIDGFSRMLIEDHGEKLDAAARSLLDRSIAASARMGELIDDLLTLSRISRSAMRPQPVDLSELMQRVVEDLRAQAGPRTLHVAVQPGVVVNGDRGLLAIVLENLVTNAIKYSSSRDPIEIGFSCVEDRDEMICCIADNGIGFDQRYVDDLFKPFCRLHQDGQYEGTGIGLATVAKIVRRHSGRVWAESALDQGASFYWALPKSGASPGGAGAGPSSD